MALRALMLRKKIDDLKKQIEELRSTNNFEAREAELTKAIEEASTDEEKQVVEEEVTKFEEEKKEYDEKEGALDKEIRELESELEEVEKEPEEIPAPAPTPEPENRKDGKNMDTRQFYGMSIQERDKFFAREDVKEFLTRLRSFKGQTRAISGSELLIPEVMLGLIKENILKYSKLVRHVNLKPVSGKARQVVAGTIPEGIWMEACASLSELPLNFYDEEVDGYKVGGYIAVCNAVLEDSDIALADEIISALGQAIGYALDKAILYGTDVKMPLGIVTRLCQEEEPSDYPATRRAWVDLSESNVLSIASSATGANFFKAFVIAAGNAKGKYSRGEKTWVMNEKTYTKIIAESVSINAAGAVVAGVNGTMPIIGGAIEVLDFIPDDVVIGGYFDLYLLAERADTKIGQSEHVQFIEDNTVFKGTARYDGTPVIDEAFVAIGINGTTPTADMEFADGEASA